MPSFVHCLKKGQEAETLVSELLLKHQIEGVSCNKASHDISFIIDSETYSLEVKFDLYSDKSGNVAIEYYNPLKCKPSGITATTADLWVYVFPDLEIHAVSTASLKEFIKANAPDRNLPKVGDGNASIYLYKKQFILDKAFTLVSNMDKEEFVTALRGLLC